jgi:hypothetical protein
MNAHHQRCELVAGHRFDELIHPARVLLDLVMDFENGRDLFDLHA